MITYFLQLILTLLMLVAPQAATVPPEQALHGVATYFSSCHRCAAASGELQALLGPDWLGKTVTVTHNGKPIDVKLVTGCGCGPRTFRGDMVPTVIDLSKDTFLAFEQLGTGVIEVTVTIGDQPVPTLPPTDTAG